MADTTFVDKQTQIVAAWLNDVNITIYRALGVGGVAPVTVANIISNLNLPQLAANNVWGGTNNFSAAAVTVASILGNPTFAGNVIVQGTTTHSGAVTNSSTVQNNGAVTNASTVQNNGVVTNAAAAWAKQGAAVAAAATTNIWAADGNSLHITAGVGAITSFGTAPQAGVSKKIVVDSAVILTNSSTLIIPGGTNLSLMPGDAFWVYADTTTIHRVLGFTPTVSLSGVLNRQVTQVIVSNTITETSVYSFSVPGGALSTNRVIRLTLLGDHLDNSAGTSATVYRVKYGATTIGTITIPAFGAARATRFMVRIICDLCASNATNSQISYMRAESDTATSSGNGTDDGLLTQANYQRDSTHLSVAEDSTAAKTFSVTVQHGQANAAIDFRCNNVQLVLV